MRQELIVRFHRRLQFVMLLVLFFPVILSALYGISAGDLDVHSTILSWSMVIVLFTIIFIIVEFREKYITDRFFEYGKGFLLWEIVALVSIMVIFLVYQGQPISNTVIFILKLSIRLTYAIPLVLTTMFLFVVFLHFYTNR